MCCPGAGGRQGWPQCQQQRRQRIITSAIGYGILAQSKVMRRHKVKAMELQYLHQSRPAGLQSAMAVGPPTSGDPSLARCSWALYIASMRASVSTIRSNPTLTPNATPDIHPCPDGDQAPHSLAYLGAVTLLYAWAYHGGGVQGR